VDVVVSDVDAVSDDVNVTEPVVVRVSDSEPVLVEVREADAVADPVLDADDVAECVPVAELVDDAEPVAVEEPVTDCVVVADDVDVEVLVTEAVDDADEERDDVLVADDDAEEVPVAEDVCVAEEVLDDVEEADDVPVLVVDGEGVGSTSMLSWKAGTPTTRALAGVDTQPVKERDGDGVPGSSSRRCGPASVKPAVEPSCVHTVVTPDAKGRLPDCKGLIQLLGAGPVKKSWIVLQQQQQ